MTTNILLRIFIQWISVVSVLCSASRPDINKCRIVETDQEVLVNCSGMALDDVPKGFPNNVSVIDLTQNNISSIGNMSFPYLPEAHTLSLYRNRITHLEAGSLKRLPSLTKLDLGKNKLNLTSLALPSGLFENIPIKLLLLSDMDIQEDDWCYAEETFSQLLDMEELAIDSPLNPNFGFGFAKMAKLQRLTVRFCHNGTLHESALDIFMNVNLTKLQVSACSKGEIDNNLVSKFPGLDILDIRNAVSNDLSERLHNLSYYSNSSMTRISFIANFKREEKHKCFMLSRHMMRFLATMCVSELFLVGNRIVLIEHGALTIEPFSLCLRSLDLSHNLIIDEYSLLQTLTCYQNLTSFTFEQTEQDFKLVDRKYPFFDSHSVFQNSNDEMVLPRGNHVQCVFSATSIGGSKELNLHMTSTVRESLGLPYPSKLNFLYFAPYLKPFDNFLDNLIFTGTKEWKTVVFANCSVEAKDVRIKGLENLQELHISGSGFTDPPVALFKSFSSLKVLSLDHITAGFHLITDNMKRVFTNLPHLKELHLLSNGLTDLPRDVEAIPNISLIDLSYNLISHFTGDVRERLDNMVSEHQNLSVNLRGNPLLCDCTHLDFIIWLKGTGVKFVDGKYYTCINYRGQTVHFKDIANASERLWRECNAPLCLSLAVCFLFLFLLGLSLSSHIARNAHLLNRWIVKRLGLNFQRYFTYDVFVYYSANDNYEQMIDTFSEEIETSRDLTLCIPERDFEPGVHTCGEVVDALNNSWKTVIFLTEAFLEDELCCFRLASAVDACQYIKPDRFIILYTNAILRHPMPTIINQLLNKDNILSLETTYQEDIWEHLYNRIMSKD
ncbi:toll-like receptor 4 [Haliotis rubra]|uniref:toll-like receptor 4 n=1 Tax=Haliotis rubra TaxID=36100 RepID=UPI001EE5DBF0|nr:toll-like receptor 4 [Haliotis rubra]